MLDTINKKIILALINNSRLSISAIAKETKLTREIVRHRIWKLEKEQIITGYITRINQPLFCTGIALMECKLTRSNIERYTQIIKYIQKKDSINWCIEICGIYDIAFTIVYNTPQDLANTITEITNYLGVNLKEHEISLYIDEYKFDRAGLITEKTSQYNKDKIITFNKNTKINLDQTDMQIIQTLAQNSRTKNIEISKKLNISEDVVRLRIRNLEKKRIITGYTISLDAEKLGYEAYQIGLKIEQMTDDTINKIKYYTQTNPYIIFCTRTTGKNNIIINVHAKNRIHFNKILLDIRNNLPEIIDYEFQLNMKTHKEIFIPEQKINNLT